MIVAKIENIHSAENILRSTYYLSSALDKKFGVVCFVSDNQLVDGVKAEITTYLTRINLPVDNVFVLNEKEGSLVDFCEQEEVSFLILQMLEDSRKTLQKGLNHCRDLRIPYLFFKNDFGVFDFKKVLLPVGFLVEEYEKAQFASAFGRFCNAEISILQANDYGTKATVTVNKMCTLFDKFSLRYSVEKGKKDSFKLDKEAVEKAIAEKYDILIISASREYGLDDLIFGPNELQVVKKSTIPVLIINPREDLYTLCD